MFAANKDDILQSESALDSARHGSVVHCSHVGRVVLVHIMLVMVLLIHMMLVMVVVAHESVDIFNVDEHGRSVWKLSAYCDLAVALASSAAADANEDAHSAEAYEHCDHDPDGGRTAVEAVEAVIAVGWEREAGGHGLD